MNLKCVGLHSLIWAVQDGTPDQPMKQLRLATDGGAVSATPLQLFSTPRSIYTGNFQLGKLTRGVPA